MHLRVAVVGLVLVPLVIAGCNERVPPPGSGALETTPIGSATHPQERLSLPRVLAYPNGSMVTTDPKTCRLRLLREGNVLWEHEFPGCGGLLEATVAMDSTLYVRDPKTVSALDPTGAVRWAEKLQNPAPSSDLATPTTLADSRIALAATAKMVVVYERTGKISWSFSPPSEEVLVAPPAGMQTEGLVLLTSRATYYLSAAGEVRFRTPGADRTAEL